MRTLGVKLLLVWVEVEAGCLVDFQAIVVDFSFAISVRFFRRLFTCNRCHSSLCCWVRCNRSLDFRRRLNTVRSMRELRWQGPSIQWTLLIHIGLQLFDRTHVTLIAIKVAFCCLIRRLHLTVTWPATYVVIPLVRGPRLRIVLVLRFKFFLLVRAFLISHPAALVVVYFLFHRVGTSCWWTCP